MWRCGGGECGDVAVVTMMNVAMPVTNWVMAGVEGRNKENRKDYRKEGRRMPEEGRNRGNNQGRRKNVP